MKISLQESIERLNNGDVVALPTETVYGLAASAFNKAAIEKIFELKKRPQDNPLIIHIENLGELDALVESIPEGAEKLMEEFWPGALTLVFPASKRVPLEARGNLGTVAIRMPAHPLIKEVLKETGPLVAPSANLSGKPSPTHPSHVEEDFGESFPLLDGESTDKGLESTVLVFTEGHWQIARPGTITAEKLSKVLGVPVPTLQKTEKPLAPGSHYRHYSPEAKLIPFEKGHEVIVGFSDRVYIGAAKVYALGPSSSPETVAKNLYSTLRKLDSDGVKLAEVDLDFPSSGLFSTIRERLLRAMK